MDQSRSIEETQDNQDPQTGRFLPGNSAALKHGTFSARIPKIRGIKRLKRELQRLRKELEANVVEITPQKALLISQVVRSETQLRLIEIYLQKHGILRPDRYKKGEIELHPALATSYLSFLNAQKQALVSLGIDNAKGEQIIDVRTYAAEKYGKEKGKK